MFEESQYLDLTAYRDCQMFQNKRAAGATLFVSRSHARLKTC